MIPYGALKIGLICLQLRTVVLSEAERNEESVNAVYQCLRCAQDDMPMITYMSNNKPVAVITGATKGIGRAIANRFAQEEFDLIVCARDKKDLDAMKAGIE